MKKYGANGAIGANITFLDQKLLASSILNSTPPIGAPKAAPTLEKNTEYAPKKKIVR